MPNPTTFIPQAGLNPVPLQLPVASYLVDGAIDMVAGGVCMLTKASAGAYTLAAPYADGALLVIVSTTAAAHVVTQTTPGFNNLGASGDVATFTAAAANYLVCVSQGGIWWVINKLNVTIA